MTTLAPIPPTDLLPLADLEQLFQKGDHYGLLNRGLPLLEHAADVRLALLVVRSYLALGLVGPARELLSDPDGPLSEMAECRRLVEQLASTPSGQVPWASLNRRFESNTARLYSRHPHLRELDSQFRAAVDGLELFQSSDGQFHVCRLRDNGQRSWLPALVDSRALAANVKLAHDPQSQWCVPYLVSGDWHFTIFDRIFDGTSKFFLTFTPRIYLLEPQIWGIAVGLYTSTNIDRLCHARVSIVIGEDCIAQLTSLLDANPAHSVPGYSIYGPTATDHAFGDRLANELGAVLQRRDIRSAEIRLNMQRKYANLTAEHWRDRFAGRKQRPLRILGITSRFTTVLQYSMRDLQAAFNSAGHEFKLVMEPSDHDLQGSVAFAQAVDEYIPDLIVLIDHHRREYPGYLPTNVPFVGWVQDMLPHLTCVEAGRSIGPLDFYIAPALYQFVQTYEYPRRQGMVWTMATNESLYSADAMDESVLAPHRCDFSFVSNQSMTAELFREQFKKVQNADAAISRLCDHLYEALQREILDPDRPGSPRRAMDLLAEATKATGIAPSSPEAEDYLCVRYLHALAELMFRHHTLTWVADYCDRTGRTLHLYGEGWERHPRFARYARGVAANGETLRAIHQATRINLQINGYGAVHQRLLDGLAAGGFFMIRRAPLDLIYEPVKRFAESRVDAVLESGRRYALAELPDLRDAFEAERIIRGGKYDLKETTLTAIEVDLFRELAAAGYRRIAGGVFEEYPSISFENRGEFERGAERFLGNDSLRRATADSMREVVLQKFTYRALVDELLNFISTRLSEKSES